MATSDTSPRQRKPAPKPSSASDNDDPPTPQKPSPGSSSRFSILSALRAVGGVLVLGSALSYIVTDGETMTWGLLPHWARWEKIKQLFTPPLLLTDAQLALYNGSDPTLPLLLALNSSIYDVSSNPTTYGPSGSYHIFVGADCTRGFVTGCFAQDRTWDLRGVEDMFLEQDDELDLFEEGRWRDLPGWVVDQNAKGGGYLLEEKRKELATRAQERREKAKRTVWEAVDHWERFFRTHEKYKWVGTVKHRDISGDPVPELCENAKRKRPLKKKD